MIPYDFYYRAAYDNFLKDIDVKCYFIKFGPKQDFEFIVEGESSSKNCIVFYDQEPFDKAVYINKMLSGRLPQGDGTRIIISSEKSVELDLASHEFNFKKFDYFYHGILCVEWYRHLWFKNIQPNANFDRLYITYNNLMLNKRLYRANLLVELRKQGLIDKGYASFNTPTISDIKTSVNAYNYLLPNSHKVNILSNLALLDQKMVLDSGEVNGSYSAELDPTHMQQAFLNLVTETIFYENKVHLTEKSFKPIVAKMPFILLAGPGSLAYLRKYGFKTFGDFWDESYDQETNPAKRFAKVVELLKDLGNLSIGELQKMHKDMLPILEHNFLHFYTELKPIIAAEFTDKLGHILSENNIDYNQTSLVALNRILSY